MFTSSLRALRRSPGFTAVAVGTLALGIGATTAIFSVVDTVMLRPPPYPHPERLVQVWETTPEGEDFSVSDPNYLDFRDRSRSFEMLAAWKQAPLALSGSGEPRRIEAMAVTHDLFPLLGARPALGRAFLPEEDLPGGNRRVVLLGHALWLEHFGGDPAIVGRTVTLDREPYTVTGVMPAGFAFPGAEAWVPLAPDPARDRDDHWLSLAGRIRPGVSLEEATADLAAIARGIGAEHPVVGGWGVRVESLSSALVGPRFRTALLVLLAGVGCLLLIGCLNLANLLLARSTVRQVEIGIRSALGAGPGRLVRELLAESLVLGVAGSVIGLLLAGWALELLRALEPEGIPRLAEVAIDLRVGLFAVLLGLATSVLFGLGPAVRAARVELAWTLRQGGRGASEGHRRSREALIVAQIALATVLLVGAGLLMRSVMRLQASHPGFDAERVTVVPLQLDFAAYAEEWRRVVFIDDLIRRIESIPGVQSAGATAVDPFSGWNLANYVTPTERAAEVGPSGMLQAGWRAVTPGFFRAMGIPVVQGRTFDPADRWDGPPLAVVSAALARRLWPGEDAVGKRLYWGGTDGDPRTVIGVVGDFRDVGLEDDPQPLLFLPNNQIAWPAMTLVIRSAGGPAGLAAAVREEIHALDPSLPVPEVRPVARSVARAVAGPRFRSMLLGSFALAALLLAGVGVYGVTAFATARRTREFGVRLALGASPGELSAMVLRGAGALAALGLALGVTGAAVLTRYLDSLLYQLSPSDPATFLGVALLLGGITLLASYLPGRRAARIDPVAALRQE